MKIWVICQYYKPEPGAPSSRLSGFARAWQKNGNDVTILTGFPNHPKGILFKGYEDKLPYCLDEVDGIKVVRHKFFITTNEGFIKKTRSHLSFMRSLLYRNFIKHEISDKPDIIIVSSPSFFAVISAWLIAWNYKVPFVFEVRDLWPGIFKDLGTIKNPFLLKSLEIVEKFLYRRSSSVVAVTEGFVKDITTRGIKENKVFCVTNGVADHEFDKALEPLSSGAASKIKNELQINPLTKVFLYIGAHGSSQSLGQIVDAARRMMARSDIVFLFVGDGADKQRVMNLAKGMPNIQFVDSVNKEAVWDYYSMAYACFVPLKDIPGFSTFIPSKMFEVWASGTPVIGCVRGEAAQIMEQSGAAYIVPPEDHEKLAKTIETLIDAPDRAEQMGKDGRKFVEGLYLHSILANKYLNILQSTVQNYHK